MTKFVSEEDPGYAAVSTELWRWVREVKARMQVATSTNVGATADLSSHQFRSPEWSAYASSQQQLLPSGNYPQHFQQGSPSMAAMQNANPANWQTLFQQHQPPAGAVSQGGHMIEGQTSYGSSKVVQGNNIRSDQDVTFNF
jgi:hypothetical protein